MGNDYTKIRRKKPPSPNPIRNSKNHIEPWLVSCSDAISPWFSHPVRERMTHSGKRPYSPTKPKCRMNVLSSSAQRTWVILRHPFSSCNRKPRWNICQHSKYAFGKNLENLTEKQWERLTLVQADDPKLKRGHDIKEKLRLIFRLKDPELAEDTLWKWLAHAQRCRIPAFVELGRKIRRHQKHILNTIRYGLSNARVEATNNKIKLPIRIAYGFRDVETTIGRISLFRSSIEIS